MSSRGLDRLEYKSARLVPSQCYNISMKDAARQRTEFINVLREELVGVGNAGVEVAEAVVPAQSQRLIHKIGGVVRGGMVRVSRQIILEKMLRQPGSEVEREFTQAVPNRAV